MKKIIFLVLCINPSLYAMEGALDLGEGLQALQRLREASPQEYKKSREVFEDEVIVLLKRLINGAEDPDIELIEKVVPQMPGLINAKFLTGCEGIRWETTFLSYIEAQRRTAAGDKKRVTALNAIHALFEKHGAKSLTELKMSR